MTETLQIRVREKIRETPRTQSLVLEPLDGTMPYRAGQFLTLLFDDLGPRPLRRSYSLSSAPGVDPFPVITVKKQVNGLVSRYLCEKAAAGMVFRALPPAGKFTLPSRGEAGNLVLFGGGSGITPLYGLLKEVLRKHPGSRVLLLDANRDERHIIFRKGLTAQARAFPDRLRLVHYLSDPVEDLHKLRTELAPAAVRWGRFSNDLMEKWFSEFVSEHGGPVSFYLCGPPSLLLKAREVLGYLGFDESQIHRELFLLSQPFRPSPEKYPDCHARVRLNRRQYGFKIEAGTTILEAAEAAGITLPFSCRSGSCTTCLAHCRKGEAEMFTPDGRTHSRAIQGDVLTCVGYPLSEELDLEF